LCAEEAAADLKELLLSIIKDSLFSIEPLRVYCVGGSTIDPLSTCLEFSAAMFLNISATFLASIVDLFVL
jgi:hypothetical protein